MGLMVNDSSLWESGFQVVGGLLWFANLSRFTPAPPGRLFCWGVVLRGPALSYRSLPLRGDSRLTLDSIRGDFTMHLAQFSKKPELVEICLSCYSRPPFPYSHVAGRF